MILEGPDDDNEDDLPSQFVHTDYLGELERQIYGHVLAAVDLDKLSNLEQHTMMLLSGDHEVPDDLAADVASQLIEGALRRVIDDPRRYMSFGAPLGVTPEEVAAVAFDEDCPYCLADRQYASEARARTENPPEDPPCACCDMLVEDWRKQHAEKLAKAGLADVAQAQHEKARSAAAPPPPRKGRRIEVS